MGVKYTKLSGIIVNEENTNINKTLKSIFKVCDEIIITGSSCIIDDEFKEKTLFVKSSINVPSMLNTAVSSVSGEYIIYFFSGEELLSCDFINKINGDNDGYYVNIMEQQESDSVITRHVRIVKKGVSFKGYEIEIPDIIKPGYIEMYIKGRGPVCKNEKKEKARILLEKLLNKNISDFRILNEIAYLNYTVGDFEKAANYYKKAYEIGENAITPNFYRNMAKALIASGKYIDAAIILEEGILNYKEYGELYYWLGYAYKQLKEYEKAHQCIEKACTSKKENMADYTEGYDSYKSFFLIGEIYEEMDDFVKSARYFVKAARNSPLISKCIPRIARNLKNAGLTNDEIEKYIQKKLNINGEEFIDTMATVYCELGEWEYSLKYSSMIQNTKNIEIKIKSLYYLKDYIECFKEINDNYNVVDKVKFGVIGFCCVLLDSEIPSDWIWDFIIKLKKDGLNDICHSYNFFAFGSKYSGCQSYIELFCKALLESSNGSCIKFVRTALENIKGLDYIDIAKNAFNNKLYYLSEEIINLYCRENKYDYEVLKLLANINYITGNIKECEKNASYALIINSDTNLRKLYCLCKLNDCKTAIMDCQDNQGRVTFNKALEYIDKAEKILLSRGTSLFF